MTQFYEGYGQTECTAGCSLTIPGDWTAGTVTGGTGLVDALLFGVGSSVPFIGAASQMRGPGDTAL